MSEIFFFSQKPVDLYIFLYQVFSLLPSFFKKTIFLYKKQGNDAKLILRTATNTHVHDHTKLCKSSGFSIVLWVL